MDHENFEEEAPEERPFNLEAVLSEYRPLYSLYESFARIVVDRIETEAQARQLHLQFTAHRPKDPDHLREKITRPDKKYLDPLTEVTDLAGARIVTDFLSDIDPILRMIRETFIVDFARSEDYRIVEDPRIFDYASAHYVVKLKDDDVAQGELRPYNGLWCEVQVRTMLQHVWATIAHERLYKPRNEPPKPLKRRFYALRGLLEVADREFDSIRKREEERKSQIEEKLENGDFDIPIDYLSLPAFLSKQGITTKAGEPISGQTIIDLVEEAEVVHLDTLGQLNQRLDELRDPEYQALVERVYEGRPRGGISLVRDAVRLADPEAYLQFALQNRPGFHPRLLREMSEGLQRIKAEKSSRDPTRQG